MMPLLVLVIAAISPSSIHVDARDYPLPGQGIAAFAAMEQALVRGFDDLCGDTFCEGDYSNLRALQLRCAVAARSGIVTACAWSFAGSHATVTGNDPLPVVDARTWICRLPIAPATPLPVLLSTLSGRDSLHTRLPGRDISTYDALTDCL